MKASKGGMQSVGLNHSIYCPQCGKPAARKEIRSSVEAYMHFTKKGTVWHKAEPVQGGGYQ